MQFSLITLAALAASTAQAAHSITLYEQKSYGGKSFPFSTNGVHSLGLVSTSLSIREHQRAPANNMM